MHADPKSRGRLLGLAGRAGCGKSTIAQALVDRGLAQRVRFAGPLKDGLVAMGLSREQVDGALKETPSHLLCGATPRHAMQTLGTEWGRNMIGPDVWVRLTMHRVDDLLASGVNVIIDDVRFDNEAEAIRERDGQLVTLVRGPVSAAAPERGLAALWQRLRARAKGTHASEIGLTVRTVKVHNDGTIADAVDEVLTWWNP